MPVILGIGVHFWASVIMLIVIVLGYYVIISDRGYSMKLKYGIIVVGATVVTLLYIFISPIVGEKLKSMELLYGDNKLTNLGLLLAGALVVTSIKHFIVDKVRYK